MKKLFLAILMLAAVTATVPSLRERAQPQAVAGWIWLAETLEGPLSPIITPLRRMETETSMIRISNGLIQERNMGLPAPLGDEYHRFLKRKDIVEHGVDAWGQEIQIARRNDELEIRSAGADELFETEDDMIRMVAFPRVQRGGAGRRGR